MINPSEEALSVLSPDEVEQLKQTYLMFEVDAAKPGKGKPMPKGKADFPPLLTAEESGELENKKP